MCGGEGGASFVFLQYVICNSSSKCSDFGGTGHNVCRTFKKSWKNISVANLFGSYSGLTKYWDKLASSLVDDEKIAHLIHSEFMKCYAL